MDHLQPALPAWGAALLAAWLVIGIGVYVCLTRLIAGGGGQVDTQEFGIADFFVAALFVFWFAIIVASGFGAPPRDVTRHEIVSGGGMFLGIVALLWLFMRFRGISPLRQFGLLRRNPFLCAAIALGLILSAFPLVFLTENLTSLALHGKSQPQNVVEFFFNASERSDKSAVFLMLMMAVLVAPIAEETIFRGYIYGVTKRYLGKPGAALLSAALFAAMHLNLAALPSLFVLALCLTLAYEATGSLLVNIFMHSLFNLSMLVAILYFTSHSAHA